MNRRTPIIEAFDQWTQERLAGRIIQPTTAETYRRHGRQLAKAIGNKAIGNVDFDDIQSWSSQTAHLSASSKASRIGALRSFFDYCIVQAILDVNPMGRLERPKVRPGDPRPEAHTAIDATLAHCEKVGDWRAHLMIRLGAELGLRRFEIAKASRRDFDFEAMDLTVVGKGAKTRKLPMSPSLATEAQRWIDDNAIDARAPMFPSRKGGAISPNRCGQILAEVSYRVGEHIEPHALRHRAATDILHTAGGIKAAQRLMGHASSATTDTYARFDTADLRQYVDEIADR